MYHSTEIHYHVCSVGICLTTMDRINVILGYVLILYLCQDVSGQTMIRSDCTGPVCLYLYSARLTPGSVTWQQSYDKCKEENLELVRIENRQIQAQMTILLKDVPSAADQLVWTAGHGSSNGEWTNLNGTKFTQTVTGSNNENCVYARLNGPTIQYFSTVCDDNISEIQVLCQYNTVNEICKESNHVSVDMNYCYVKTKYNGRGQKIDWFGARNYCQDEYDADVVHYIHPTYINSIFNLLGPTDVWFGAWRPRWYWRSGPDAEADRMYMDFFNWDGSNNFGRYSTPYQCVYVDSSAGDGWRAQDCTNSLSFFVCMSDKPTTTKLTTTVTVTEVVPAVTTQQSHFDQSTSPNVVSLTGEGRTISSTTPIIMGVVIVVMAAIIISGVVAVVLWRRKRLSRRSKASSENTQQNSVAERGPDDGAYDEISDMAANQSPRRSSTDHLRTVIEPTRSSQTVTYEQVDPPAGYENVALSVDPGESHESTVLNEIQNNYEHPSNYVNMIDRPNTYDSLKK